MPPAATEVIVTEKQAAVLRAIGEYGEVGVSVSGAAAALGLEKAERSAVGTHVNALLKKDLIKKVAGAARYEITYEGRLQTAAFAAAAADGADHSAYDQSMIDQLD
ncbi:hypothetical protein ACH4OW_26210 [Streptomyces sp. NPDC017056]|uniref:hypothetical protein n=1 Tax=Streptomyces sp. NPDC017056 TaxID=3364973 RepID=UPI0037AE3880